MWDGYLDKGLGSSSAIEVEQVGVLGTAAWAKQDRVCLQATLEAVCVQCGEFMTIGDGHELSEVVLLLGFCLDHFLALAFGFLDGHFAGLCEDKHAQKDDEDCFVHCRIK